MGRHNGVTLRDYIDSRFDAVREAIVKADSANEKRFDGVNEFRKTLSDQTRSFITRVELEGLERRVQDLTDRMNKTEGRSGGLHAGWGYLMAALGLVVAIAVALFK